MINNLIIFLVFLIILFFYLIYAEVWHNKFQPYNFTKLRVIIKVLAIVIILLGVSTFFVNKESPSTNTKSIQKPVEIPK